MSTPSVHELWLAGHRGPDRAVPRSPSRWSARSRSARATASRSSRATPSPPGMRRCWPSTPRRCLTPGSRSPRSPSRRRAPTASCSTSGCMRGGRGPGQAAVAAQMRGAPRRRVDAWRGPGYVLGQDPYAFRVVPQVDGVTHEALSALEEAVDRRAQPRRRERAASSRTPRWRSPTATPTRRAWPRRSTACAARSRSPRR